MSNDLINKKTCYLVSNKLSIMNRRTFIQNSALTIGALTVAQKSILSGFFEDPWKIKMLTGDLGIFTEKGGTIAFLLSKKGIVVVDSQFPDQSRHLIDELKKKYFRPYDRHDDEY